MGFATMVQVVLGIFLVILFSLVGCKSTKESSQTKEMQPIVVDKILSQPLGIQLDFIDSFNTSNPRHSITYQVKADYWDEETLGQYVLRTMYDKDLNKPEVQEKYESMVNLWKKHRFLKVDLGKLSPEAFQHLKGHFNDESFVTYDPNRQYSLQDFLSPIIQAANYHVFFFEGGKDSRGKSTSLTTNCWGTAYEFLRHRGFPRDGYFISPSYLDDPNVHGVFIDPGRHTQAEGSLFNGALSAEALIEVGARESLLPIYQEKAALWRNFDFETLAVLGLQNASAGAFLNDLKYGDVIIVRRAEGEWEPEKIEHRVVHIVIYLGSGLVFEKAGINSLSPYRISTFEEVLKDWPLEQDRSDGTKRHFQFLARRLHSPLPHISQIIVEHRQSFSDAAAEDYRVLFRSDGTAYLEEKAYAVSLMPD